VPGRLQEHSVSGSPYAVEDHALWKRKEVLLTKVVGMEETHQRKKIDLVNIMKTAYELFTEKGSLWRKNKTKR
jgi:hypothetical protein